MNGISSYAIYAAALLLIGYACARHRGAIEYGFARAAEQFLQLMPRMVMALIAAGFIVKMIPTEIISRFLGAEAGFTGIVVGSLAGLLVPSGPVISFAIAASFAAEGASVPALVSFITAWSVFAAHRVLIFEIPLLGASFVRLRLLSVAMLPFIAGSLALAAVTVLAASHS